jgi:hypothetical protein
MGVDYAFRRKQRGSQPLLLEKLLLSGRGTCHLISLPVVLPAIFLGRVLNHRLRGDTFLKYVHVGLVGAGVLLVIQALRKV